MTMMMTMMLIQLIPCICMINRASQKFPQTKKKTKKTALEKASGNKNIFSV